MTKEEAKKIGATHYIDQFEEMWFLRWSFLLGQYVVLHGYMWVTFHIEKSININPL